MGSTIHLYEENVLQIDKIPLAVESWLEQWGTALDAIVYAILAGNAAVFTLALQIKCVNTDKIALNHGANKGKRIT
jgi:hypothetical protein